MAAHKKPVLTDLSLVNEAIERAVAPFVGLFSASQLDEMREVLADFIVTSPTGAGLVRDLEGATRVDASGTKTRDGLGRPRTSRRGRGR